MEEESQHTRKIGLKVSGQNALVSVAIGRGLRGNLEILKATYKLPMENRYDFIVEHSKDVKRKGMYVTEQTFDSDVQHGNTLEIALALEDRIAAIFGDTRDLESLRSVFSLSGDPAFVSKIVELNHVSDLVSLIKLEHIETRARAGCLLTTLKLLQGGHIKNLEEDILDAITGIVIRNNSENAYALSVLSQILYIRDLELCRSKELIIGKIHLEHLLPLISIRDGAGAELSLNSLMLINAIIATVKDDRRMPILSQLRLPENRLKFYQLIKVQTVNENLARELFILQTYLLSPYVKTLSRIVSWDNLTVIDSNRSSRDIDDDDSSMDLEVYETVYDDVRSIRDTLSRYSLASLSTLRSSSGDCPDPSGFISQLTNNCLAHYRNKYHKNFHLSLREENNSEPGMARSSERIVQIMAQVLNIGNKIYKKGTRYLPVYFNPETHYFFEEIFIRMMYLLSQNKRKMKAKTLGDFEKVIMVLKKQLEMILERKPDSLKGFTALMSEITYEGVCGEWQRERHVEWMKALRTNPCIVELSRELSSKNESLLNVQRLSVLMSGGIFPRLPEKKHKPQHFIMKLTANKRTLLMGDCNNNCSDFAADATVFKVDDIRHFVIGMACPHVKDNSVPASKSNLVFSVLFGENVSINCVCGDEKAANYWIDGFHILMGNTPTSKNYYEELETLTELDTSLRLIELQNVKIPLQPPPVPPLPPTRTSPAVPPKMRYSCAISCVETVDEL